MPPIISYYCAGTFFMNQAKARKHSSVSSMLLITQCFTAVLMFIWLSFHRFSNLNNQTINSRFPGDRALPHSLTNTNPLWKTEPKVHSNGQWPVPQFAEHTGHFVWCSRRSEGGRQTEFHWTLERHCVGTLAFSLMFEHCWKSWWGMQSADHLQPSASAKQTSTIQSDDGDEPVLTTIHPSIHESIHLFKINARG